VGFEGGLTQLPGPGTQRPVRPVPAKMDHAVSDLSDDAGRWFLVGMVADPWVLKCGANIVLDFGVDSLISPLLNQTSQPGRDHSTSPLAPG